MSPEKPCELEVAGVDPDGFHEDPDAPVPGADLPDVSELLDGGLGGELLEEVPVDRPSGVYERAERSPRVPKPVRGQPVISRPGAGWVQGPDGEDLCVSVRKVGCFLLRPDGHRRHRVFNLLTGFQHVTYGSDAEVDEEYLRQAKSWELKLSPVKRQGSGWRQHNFQPKT